MFVGDIRWRVFRLSLLTIVGILWDSALFFSDLGYFDCLFSKQKEAVGSITDSEWVNLIIYFGS